MMFAASFPDVSTVVEVTVAALVGAGVVLTLFLCPAHLTKPKFYKFNFLPVLYLQSFIWQESITHI